MASQKKKLNFQKRCFQLIKPIHGPEVEKWLERITKFSDEISFNLDDILIKGTAKLDGFAGYDDGIKLYTRGDGNKGSDISRVFERGLGLLNDSERGQGPGEIVVKRSYFESHLSNHFEYPRNFQASLIKEKELDHFAKDAIMAKAALFVPFKQLPFWQGGINEFKNQFAEIVLELEQGVDFDIDGVVFEAVNSDLKAIWGQTESSIGGKLLTKKIKKKHKSKSFQ